MWCKGNLRVISQTGSLFFAVSTKNKRKQRKSLLPQNKAFLQQGKKEVSYRMVTRVQIVIVTTSRTCFNPLWVDLANKHTLHTFIMCCVTEAGWLILSTSVSF